MKKEHKQNASPKEGGVSVGLRARGPCACEGRKVTQIDYGKHEDTVKELDRQEKEQEYQRFSAAISAAFYVFPRKKNQALERRGSVLGAKGRSKRLRSGALWTTSMGPTACGRPRAAPRTMPRSGRSTSGARRRRSKLRSASGRRATRRIAPCRPLKELFRCFF